MELEIAPGVVVQLVRRGGKPYIRLKPFTAYVPSAGQARMRALMARIGEMARRLSDEEVARIVGGTVARPNMILMPDGRVLPKAAALAAHYLRGRRASVAQHRLLSRIPKWERAVSAAVAEQLRVLAGQVAHVERLASHVRREA